MCVKILDRSGRQSIINLSHIISVDYYIDRYDIITIPKIYSLSIKEGNKLIKLMLTDRIR